MAIIKQETRTIRDDRTKEILTEDQADTVQFGLDGVNFKIDLAREGKLGANALRAFLAPYIAAGTIVEDEPDPTQIPGQTQIAAATVAGRKSGQGNRPGRGRKRGGAGSVHTASAVRAWAKAEKLDVPDRGRVPGDVKNAYALAHQISVDDIS
ncbi:histone-like nucleoid-structuring protein Lsr2 [Kitasatospora sp. NPDC056800]|uniref:Lsr2 dimerization domain-containing protein n=1 Tax=Kitasatospora sp. NPDC056800 TaxID=3345948 RepID=UPI0036B6EE91